MGKILNIEAQRRQPYISSVAFKTTVKHFDEDKKVLEETLEGHAGAPFERSLDLKLMAYTQWFVFQLRYTAGEDLANLSRSLADIVQAYERYADETDKVPDENYFPPVVLDDTVDGYVDYLNLLSASILLHREDLVPRIHKLISGTDYDAQDAVIEEMLAFFLPDRPKLDEWYWEKPYRLLLDAVDCTDRIEQSKMMKRYVKDWYPRMKGQSHFCGKHEHISDSFSPYCGYWAMCAAAFTYLYDIDDSSYRDELVYPKDLVDYARSAPRQAVALDDGVQLLRVLGGQPCPKEGKWFSSAKIDSTRHFKAGEMMPSFEASEVGTTIWQWIPEARDS